MEIAGRVADAFGLGRVLDCRPMTGGVMNLSWRLTTPAGTFADADLAPCGWTHGDLQPFNLLVDAEGRVTGILDWDRLGVRTYGLEVVRTATITFGRSTDRMAAFVRGYRTHVPITGAQLADAAHRRWWTLLTEAWPLDRHYDDNDHTCDHLFARRSDYLRWWTAHRDEVAAALR